MSKFLLNTEYMGHWTLTDGVNDAMIFEDYPQIYAKAACTFLVDTTPLVWVNPDYCEKLSDAEFQAVLLHEVGHIELGHLIENPVNYVDGEIAADNWAMANGASPMDLLCAIQGAIVWSIRSKEDIELESAKTLAHGDEYFQARAWNIFKHIAAK